MAFPNYTEDPCSKLIEDMIYERNSRYKSHIGLQINTRFEIGDDLRKDHVYIANNMVQDNSKLSMNSLKNQDLSRI